jgi:hypothetical protein
MDVRGGVHSFQLAKDEERSRKHIEEKLALIK